MHKVTYKDGHTSLIHDSKAERIDLLHKQQLLNARQLLWFGTVKEIVKIRSAPNHQLLVKTKTKDMICNCDECEQNPLR